MLSANAVGFDDTSWVQVTARRGGITCSRDSCIMIERQECCASGVFHSHSHAQHSSGLAALLAGRGEPR